MSLPFAILKGLGHLYNVMVTAAGLRRFNSGNAAPAGAETPLGIVSYPEVFALLN